MYVLRTIIDLNVFEMYYIQANVVWVHSVNYAACIA